MAQRTEFELHPMIIWIILIFYILIPVNNKIIIRLGTRT